VFDQFDAHRRIQRERKPNSPAIEIYPIDDPLTILRQRRRLVSLEFHR